jgi:hypothetical protein
LELFEQYDVDGHAAGDLKKIALLSFLLFIMAKLLEFESEVEFVADINDFKDCLMSQDPTQENPNALWFNIDIPKGHAVKAGDHVRVTIEKL